MYTNEVKFPDGAVAIDSYAADGFRVGGMVFHGPVAVFADRAGGWAGLHDLAPFLAAAGEIDILLVGMGADLAAPDAEFARQRARLEAAGLGVELMTTPSACRTYNVLLSEGRRVAAALLPV